MLRRPHRVEPLLTSIAAATPEPYRALFVCTADDHAEQDAIRAINGDLVILPGSHQSGDYARKINFGYRMSTEPLLFLAADDLSFRSGWLERAAACLSETIHVVGTNDLGNDRVRDGRHATHSVVRRSYVDERGTIDGPGAVLCERYHHWYVDDEFIQTAQARGAFAACLDSIVEHLHPDFQKGPYDDVYELGTSHTTHDERVFHQRLDRIRAAG